MEVIGRQIERKHVGENDVACNGDVLHCIGLEIGRRAQRLALQLLSVLVFTAVLAPARAL
jgi:hypothetical protein